MTDADLRKIYNQKKKKVKNKKNGQIVIIPGFETITIEAFRNWFNLEVFNKGCHYCRLTNSQSLDLYHKRQSATRGGKRGKRLELDRKNPALHYDQIDNIVWCCYWCNNAKSNFFTEEEFKPIGESIGKVLKSIKIV